MTRRRFFNASAVSGAGVLAKWFLGGRNAAASSAGVRQIRVPETEIPVAAEADVVVVGGGPAGFGAAGDIPEGLYLPYQYTVGGGWGGYAGCPQLNMCALRGNGEMLVWSFSPYHLGLNPAENGFDASRGEIQMRKLNIAEVKFLKKYVPGFEHAYLSGMAPYMALREGRHPQGEYVLTRDDILKESKFPDAVFKRTLDDPLDTSEVRMPRVNERGELIRGKPFSGNKPRTYTCDIPYRAFLPQKIDNLLLAGECLSCTHEWFYGYRLIPWCMRTGELAGTAAALALKQGITPKDIRWTRGYYEEGRSNT